MLSNSRVTKLGELLKQGRNDASILTELEEFRSEFVPTYNYVVRILQEKLYLSVTGRFKSTLSIVEKLRRTSSRLSQIQDIAGCRAVVASTSEQKRITQSICQWFTDTKIIDRTSQPNNGYRAVHILVRHDERLVEVQIRTGIQNFWASISEKMSDIHGQELKYGGGPADIQKHLLLLSQAFAEAEYANEAYGMAVVRLSAAKKVGVTREEWKSFRDARDRTTTSR